MYVRAMNTVIGCQNCEVKDFMLKCAHDWNAWLVGVREIFGNLSFRRQWKGLWGLKVDKAGLGLCAVAVHPEHSECHVVLHGNFMFWLSDPCWMLKAGIFHCRITVALPVLLCVTSDVTMNTGPNVEFGMVWNVAAVTCLNVWCCRVCTAPRQNSARLWIGSRLQLDSGASRTWSGVFLCN